MYIVAIVDGQPPYYRKKVAKILLRGPMLINMTKDFESLAMSS